MLIKLSLKKQVHQELILRYREFFESTVAIHVLKHVGAFESVKKISSAILQLLQTHDQKVLELLETKPRIVSDLREPFFGACFGKEERVCPAHCFNKMKDILEDPAASLKQVMQIHGVFIYRIYDELCLHPKKAAYVKALFPDSLFKDRSRESKSDQTISETSRLGISQHPVFKSRLGLSDKKHVRGMDTCRLKTDSLFSKTAKAENLPTASGPSGHAGSFLLGALCYGDLSQEQLREYSFIIFSFLAGGGHHSFHEVMLVANGIGLDYQPGEYAVPVSIEQTQGFEQLRTRVSI